jgi:XrtJ-associated TM-motif-TM protein
LGHRSGSSQPAKIHLLRFQREGTLKKSSSLSIGLALMFVVVLPLHAQSGCADSPENPTVILALVGSAGALFTSVRARIRTRIK